MIKPVRVLLLAASVFSIFPAVATANSPSLAAGITSGSPGIAVTIPITLTAGSTQVAAFQCSIGLPSGWSIGSTSPGGAATSAAKTVAVNPSNGMMIVYGSTQQAIASGVIASIQINIPVSAVPGVYPVPITEVIFSDPDGSSVAADTSASGSVTIQGTSSIPIINSFSASPVAITAGGSSTLSWSITGAASLTVTPSVGTVGGSSVSVSPALTTTYMLTATNALGSVTASTTVTVTSSAFRLVPTVPCRVVDTRNPNGAFGSPIMAANSTRTFTIPASSCGIPSAAVAYSLNVTVVPNAQLNYLTIWPTGQSQPLVSTLNSDGRIKANAAIVPAGTGGAVSVYVSDPTQVILDIDAYFVPAQSWPTALTFYPLTPCRIADTRQGTGSLAGPYVKGGATGRTFPLLSSSCSIPSTAQIYSLNFTAVPHGPLGYVTVWPTGQSQPLVSTLNASTGAITANAALVPAGSSGNISVFASNDTDLVIDIDGYFALPGVGGLSLYTLAPCRVLDTRNPPGSLPFNATLPVNVVGSGCGAPSGAQAFVLNATVVPSGPLQYLTLGPDGQSLPLFSTLNAVDGVITSNMAIAPSTNGLIDAFASNPTQLVLDMSSYFAP